jgi:hypothetical protein
MTNEKYLKIMKLLDRVEVIWGEVSDELDALVETQDIAA